MGRRQLITKTDIKRLMSSFRQIDSNKERNMLLSSRSGGGKDGSTTTVLKKVEFDINTRKANITFLQTHSYRTIERYVTQNYEKYPIYSNWKIKEKTIKHSIKLDNFGLENLNRHSEPLIKEYAFDIISRIDEIDYPSWFLIQCYRRAYEVEKNTLQDQINECEREYKKREKAYEEFKEDLERRNVVSLYESSQKKHDELLKQAERIQNFNKHLLRWLKIITLGVVNFFISEKRIEKLNKKALCLETATRQYKQLIQNAQNQEKDLVCKKAYYDSEKQKLRDKIQSEYKKMADAIKEVEPLCLSSSNLNDFVALKTTIGIPYEKIIGCYIIRNKNNSKCYVGQSKDVHKRIKQHFHGLEPANIIFAEDYYLTEPKDRADLFEIKILRCETKDELDTMERDLIEIYDAYSNGYNGTSGNK